MLSRRRLRSTSRAKEALLLTVDGSFGSPPRLAPNAGLGVVQASRVARCRPRGKTSMAKQQISKHAKDAIKGDTVAADRPARADQRQTRRCRPRARSRAA